MRFRVSLTVRGIQYLAPNAFLEGHSLRFCVRLVVEAAVVAELQVEDKGLDKIAMTLNKNHARVW
jgi:hypothetical protein